jgi:hypothetical protein
MFNKKNVFLAQMLFRGKVRFGMWKEYRFFGIFLIACNFLMAPEPKVTICPGAHEKLRVDDCFLRLYNCLAYCMEIGLGDRGVNPERGRDVFERTMECCIKLAGDVRRDCSRYLQEIEGISFVVTYVAEPVDDSWWRLLKGVFVSPCRPPLPLSSEELLVVEDFVKEIEFLRQSLIKFFNELSAFNILQALNASFEKKLSHEDCLKLLEDCARIPSSSQDSDRVRMLSELLFQVATSVGNDLSAPVCVKSGPLFGESSRIWLQLLKVRDVVVLDRKRLQQTLCLKCVWSRFWVWIELAAKVAVYRPAWVVAALPLLFNGDISPPLKECLRGWAVLADEMIAWENEILVLQKEVIDITNEFKKLLFPPPPPPPPVQRQPAPSPVVQRRPVQDADSDSGDDWLMQHMNNNILNGRDPFEP